MDLSKALEKWFPFHLIEEKRLISGNIWGTKPGRQFSFSLETQGFFDLTNPQHSGKGVEQLFEKRGESLPQLFQHSKKHKSINTRNPFLNHKVEKIYFDGPFPVPPDFVAPASLTFQSGDEKKGFQKFPCTTFTYKNEFGQRVGFILKTQLENGQRIERPMSVWNRLYPDNVLKLSYRQKLFKPCVYHLDLILTKPEKHILLFWDEEHADTFFFQGVKRFQENLFPFHTTTWPLGPHQFHNDEFWKYIQNRDDILIFLPPSQKNPYYDSLIRLQKLYLKKARFVDPVKDFGFEERDNLLDLMPQQFMKIFEIIKREFF